MRLYSLLNIIIINTIMYDLCKYMQIDIYIHKVKTRHAIAL